MYILGAPKIGHEVLQHPDIVNIANKYGKSAANVVLRWHTQMLGLDNLLNLFFVKNWKEVMQIDEEFPLIKYQ